MSDKLQIKTPKEKIEALAEELEKNPQTEDLSVVLFIVAGTTILGKEAQKSLATWCATWANSVINEVEAIREEETVDELSKKIIEGDNKNE
tara:strand:+ start:4952 stop:5224 length:273 start_codon:yes stop_codon:yes gene_type:complete